MDSVDKLPVHEVMTREPLVTAPLDTPITGAAELMRRANVGGIVVTDQDRPVGMLTERDVVQKVVAAEKAPEKILARDVMSQPLITTEPEADTAEAVRVMTRHRVRRLPVVDGGRVVGILTDRDILAISPALFDIARDVTEIRAERTYEREQEIGQAAPCEGCGRLADGLTLRGGELLCEDCIDGNQ